MDVREYLSFFDDVYLIDVMVYLLFIIVFLEKDGVWKFEVFEEVVEIVFRFYIVFFIIDDNIGIWSLILFKLWKK